MRICSAKRHALCVLCVVLVGNGLVGLSLVRAAELVSRETELGRVVGYQDTPLLPWTGNEYHVHDPDRPVPKVVVPRPAGSSLSAAPAPADALVLFDGEDASQWKNPGWEIREGVLYAGHGALESKESFGDCQLHLEFATPEEAPDRFMNRGNSGVLFMDRYELQIFDSWHEHPQHIYPDGQAAAIYGQTPPLVNACMPPGRWQSFDIVFTAPVFKEGQLAQRPSVTMYHNGVLVHHNQAVMGEMAHRRIQPCAPHPAELPLVLQGHGSAVRFRNIWIRELEMTGQPRRNGQ